MPRADNRLAGPPALPSHRLRRRLGRRAAVLVLVLAGALASPEALAASATAAAPSSVAPPAPAPAHPESGSKAAPKPPQNLEPMGPKAALPLLGVKVWGPKGEDMGMIVNVLVDADGNPRAAVIDFGGFLGVGTRKIAIDWRLLHFRPADSKISVSLSLSRAQVQAAPEYKPPSSSPEKPAEVLGPPSAPRSAPALPDAGE